LFRNDLGPLLPVVIFETVPKTGAKLSFVQAWPRTGRAREDLGFSKGRAMMRAS
jgi:hypothetical protein